ncbi:MAG: MFS transporter, partial [Aeromicrobium sp.]|uniref:MFS transporter n=1 Tax=Aeromicrobium sp. TaxID=1871063 RepID=UPI0039E2171B
QRAAQAARGAGHAVAGGGRWALGRARRFTHSAGAGETGLSRVIELHAFNAAGDAALAISLAGTVFFAAPTDEAAGKVALFLVLTMLPFAVIAPLIGPFLDRFRRGRRWAIGTTFAIRAFCCWVLAGAVADESPAFFVAALGCLVASKAYGITRASAVPRLLPEQLTLVKANSRISLTGTAAGAISAPMAVGAASVGPDWSLRYAFVLFVVGTVLAILLPAKVDSSEGEEKIDLTSANGVRGVLAPRGVVNALRCNAGLRLITGFLTIFMAFVLREPPDAMGWSGNATILMGLVIGGAGAGNTVGVLLGNALRTRAPEVIVMIVLVLDTAVLAVVSLTLGWATAIVLGLTAGLCQSLGKLSLDALIQRDVPEQVRTSMFARSETLLQLSWVIGGLVGIGLYTLDPDGVRPGLLIVAGLMLAWLAFVVARLRATHPSRTTAPPPETP